ncbi:MAG: phage major capsid protein [Clostridia bacterium]|nr:phage major capsid protein [Clostridia bacterium]
MATYDNIRLEKGLYTTGKSFTQALESIDPSENYKGTALEGLDAFQRQLKRFDIKVGGKNSDSIEKFFRTTESAALFPEYVSRAVHQGFTENDLVSRIVATTTDIDSLDYRSLAVDMTKREDVLKDIMEGTHIPETRVSVKENLVKLRKTGRMITASYEAIKYQRIDLFTIALRQIGHSIANTQFHNAVSEILADDGSGQDFEPIMIDSLDALSYNDLITLWASFRSFKLTTLIVGSEVISKLLKMEEFRDSAAGLNFHATGNLITPFGAEIIYFPDLPADKIIALDKSSALERVQAGGIVTDFDKLIDRQLERASVTSTTGFAKIYNEATKFLIMG